VYQYTPSGKVFSEYEFLCSPCTFCDVCCGSIMMMCPAGSGVVDVRVFPAWGVVVICRCEGRVMLRTSTVTT